MYRKLESRRAFLAKSILASGGVILSSQLVGLEKNNEWEMSNLDGSKGYHFLHGVGSFDPISSAVIIWTRFTPTEALVGQSIQVRFEVSKNHSFTQLVAEGMVKALPKHDYTVMVDVNRLPSNSKFFYRFSYENAQSVVGETLTLPEPSAAVNELTIAVCSCSNYPTGYFNVYDAIAKSEADVVLHLGDYIYEYGGPESYGDNPVLKRQHDPYNEILTLEEYRKRYRQYRSDESLQLVHQKKPFIVVWDDHEVANDAFKEGAENHQENEGDFEERKTLAIKVHDEYLPIRRASSSTIYRNFEFGTLVNLVMLDTRIVGRDRQIDIKSFYSPEGFNAADFSLALADPSRRLLGETQLNWAAKTITSSSATWQVLGQQVLMGKLFLPAELLVANANADAGKISRAQVLTLQTELTQLKSRLLQGDTSLSAIDLERIKTLVPYNLDAWDGYFAEREMLYDSLRDKKVVVFAGDTHNAWHNELQDVNGMKIGEEFATPSVTSSGLENYLELETENIPSFEESLQILIDNLKYLDASRRGFLLTHFTSTTAKTSYRFVDNIHTQSYEVAEGKSISYSG